MKKLITNYTFNPTAKTVTFNDYTSISLERVLLITNVTSNIMIYNFADIADITDIALGGSVLGNVLTLVFDTSTMSDTDKIQIFYDDAERDNGALGFLADMSVSLRNIFQTLIKPIYVNPANGHLVMTTSTLGTVATVASVSNVVQLSGADARLNLVIPSQINAWSTTVRRNVT